MTDAKSGSAPRRSGVAGSFRAATVLLVVHLSTVHFSEPAQAHDVEASCHGQCAVETARDWQLEVRRWMAAKEWDRAIRILDGVLEQEPEDLAARRLRAICYREKAHVLFENVRWRVRLARSDMRRAEEVAREQALGGSRRLDWAAHYDVTRAIGDFEFILARDSSYLDVLVQYARLWREHEVFDRAIELGEEQIRRVPDMPDAHVYLVLTYRHFVAWTNARDALLWLEARATPYAEYFTGEVHRRAGRLEQADRFLADLLRRPLAIPAQPALLSRARIRIARRQYEEAYEFIERAMQFETTVEARLLFEDFKYVLTDVEFEESALLHAPAQFADFFARMWSRRNPAPASRINWRLVEHYRRMLVAEQDYEYFAGRTWHTAADRGRQLDYPPAFWLNREFNDRGLIYVRHGEPDERIASTSGPHESWRYRAEGRDFHFAAPTPGNNWRLLPVVTDCRMLDELRMWGGYYVSLAPRAPRVDPRAMGAAGAGDPCGPGRTAFGAFDVQNAQIDMELASRRFVMEGLMTDRHTWTDAVESFDFPYFLSAFRGSDGTADVAVYYAMPIGRFSEALTGDTLDVEIGLALQDIAWSPVVSGASVLRFPRTDDPGHAAFGEMRFAAPADSYHVSLHGDLLGHPLLAGYRFGWRIPDFSRAETMMSDVVLAYAVVPLTEGEIERREDVRIVANPFLRSPLDQPLHVYFEVYYLALDAEDLARYRVEYVLEPTESRGGFLGLFRRSTPGLSVAADFESATPSPIVYSGIDVSRLAAGAYRFIARVTDVATGQVMERSIQIELY